MPEDWSLNQIGLQSDTRGSETSQYPEDKKTTVIPPVAASERGVAQTVVLAPRGCGTLTWHLDGEPNGLESPTIAGDSPVSETLKKPRGIPSKAGHVKPCLNPGGPPPKAKYLPVPDSELVPRGKGEKNRC